MTGKSSKARKFGDLAGRLSVAGIKELSKSDAKAAYIAAQEMEQELLKEQAAYSQQQQTQATQNAQVNELSEGMDGKLEDEIKSEKGLELQAQLPFQKKQQLQNVQALKSEIANQLSAEHSFRNRFTPGGS